VIIETPPSTRAVIACVLLLGTFAFTQISCKSGQAPGSTDAASQDLALLTTPPFSTKEPQRYQAVRTITSNGKDNGEPVVTKTLIAREGSMRREEYETHGGHTVVFLEIPQGKFVLLPAAKLVAAMTDSPEAEEGASRSELSTDFLLNQTPTETRYQRLGPEAVSGRGATKYRVLTRSAATEVTPDTQTLIWIDDELGIPVRSETTSNAEGGAVTSKMELSDIRLNVDPNIFRLPADYRKVALNALYSTNSASATDRKSKPRTK